MERGPPWGSTAWAGFWSKPADPSAGGVKTVESGEVSVRGVYGYVLIWMRKQFLCGANSYTQKYYFNDEFFHAAREHSEGAQDPLRPLCGGCGRDPDAGVQRRGKTWSCGWKMTRADYLFDEIGSVLKIKQIQREKSELLESLELFLQDVLSEQGTDSKRNGVRRE